MLRSCVCLCVCVSVCVMFVCVCECVCVCVCVCDYLWIIFMAHSDSHKSSEVAISSNCHSIRIFLELFRHVSDTHTFPYAPTPYTRPPYIFTHTQAAIASPYTFLLSFLATFLNSHILLHTYPLHTSPLYIPSHTSSNCQSIHISFEFCSHLSDTHTFRLLTFPLHTPPLHIPSHTSSNCQSIHVSFELFSHLSDTNTFPYSHSPYTHPRTHIP